MEPAGMPAGAVSTMTETHKNFVDWGAVFAGAAIASALSVVLLTFGSTIGLSFTSPWSDGRLSAKWVASLAVFWALSQQIGAAIAGGYVAGRMRSRWAGTAEHEVEFRDGLHGGLVWALSEIISAIVLVSAATSIGKTGTEIAGRAAGNFGPTDYYTDVLLREQTAVARPVGAAAGSSTAGAPYASNAETRAEALRIVGRSISNRTLGDADRAHLANLVSRRTGLPMVEAEKRVNDTFVEAQRAIKDAADVARRGAVLTGFVTAAALLVSLSAAWWAAQRGGHHRDNSVPAQFFVVATTRRY